MRILMLILTLMFSQNIMASTLKLNYSLFFGYMKTMYKLDYQHVATGFYLVEQSTGNKCFIEQVEIVVDNKREKHFGTACTFCSYGLFVNDAVYI